MPKVVWYGYSSWIHMHKKKWRKNVKQKYTKALVRLIFSLQSLNSKQKYSVCFKKQRGTYGVCSYRNTGHSQIGNNRRTDITEWNE